MERIGLLFSLLFIEAMIEAMPTPQELQRNIIVDRNELPRGREQVPDFYALSLNRPAQFLQGTLVNKRFKTVEELKKVHPVKEVTGEVIAGPFTLQEAISRAGREILMNIFGPSIMSQYPNSADNRINNNLDSPATKVYRKSSEDSLLVGKLVNKFKDRAEVDQKFMRENRVKEYDGKVLAEDEDIKMSKIVENPERVFKSLKVRPEIREGILLSGSLNGVPFMDGLPDGDDVKGERFQYRGQKPRRRLMEGKAVGDVMRDKREADEKVKRMGIEGQVEEKEGQIAAEDKDISRSNKVANPLQVLKALGPEKVRKIPVESGKIVAGIESRLEFIDGNPVQLAKD